LSFNVRPALKRRSYYYETMNLARHEWGATARETESREPHAGRARARRASRAATFATPPQVSFRSAPEPAAAAAIKPPPASRCAGGGSGACMAAALCDVTHYDKCHISLGGNGFNGLEKTPAWLAREGGGNRQAKPMKTQKKSRQCDIYHIMSHWRDAHKGTSKNLRHVRRRSFFRQPSLAEPARCQQASAEPAA
jgi:hypothetical protein